MDFKLLFYIHFVLIFTFLENVKSQSPESDPSLQFAQNYFNIFLTPWNYWQGGPAQSPAFEAFARTYQSNLSDIASKCNPRETYASFNPLHRLAGEELAALFQDNSDPRNLLQFSQFAKSRPEIHPHIWFAALIKSQARVQPQRLKIQRPSSVDLFPSEYFPAEILQLAVNQSGYGNQGTPGGGGIRGKRQLQLLNPPLFQTNLQPSQSFQPQPGQMPRFQPGQMPRRQPGPMPPPQPGPMPPPQPQQCVIVDERVGQDNGPENALWYFREDVQLNEHHFIWHLMFPVASTQPINRRGELFYFVHHDILARYATERLANGLSPVVPEPLFANWGSVLEGFDAHLTDAISSRSWAPRAPNTPLNQNTLSQDIGQRLQNIQLFMQRIVEMLNSGMINVNGQMSPVANVDNINAIGDLFEASVLSVNQQYYGSVHNDAHWVIANLLTNIPQGSLGVMGHTATAIRDPVFYRVHQAIDVLFSAYKNLLPPYALAGGEHPLIFDGIRIAAVSVQSQTQGAPVNSLRTFWNLRQFLLEGGLDFNAANSQAAPTVSLCAKHLDHDEFTYRIQVDNNRNAVTNAFVRIFMAPRYRTAGGLDRYSFEEQRLLFFKMDSFIQVLEPGTNVITRESISTTLTVPWPESIQQLRQNVQNRNTGQVNCECGFPHHLLLPKGTEQGMVFDVFVMITNADQDFVQGTNQNQFGQCIPSHIHCGILGQPYPDAKPLGYPFDRRPYTTQVQGADANGNPVMQNVPPPNLESYASQVPNIGITQVTITHQNIQVGG